MGLIFRANSSGGRWIVQLAILQHRFCFTGTVRFAAGKSGQRHTRGVYSTAFKAKLEE